MAVTGAGGESSEIVMIRRGRRMMSDDSRQFTKHEDGEHVSQQQLVSIQIADPRR